VFVGTFLGLVVFCVEMSVVLEVDFSPFMTDICDMPEPFF